MYVPCALPTLFRKTGVMLIMYVCYKWFNLRPLKHKIAGSNPESLTFFFKTFECILQIFASHEDWTRNCQRCSQSLYSLAIRSSMYPYTQKYGDDVFKKNDTFCSHLRKIPVLRSSTSIQICDYNKECRMWIIVDFIILEFT